MRFVYFRPGHSSASRSTDKLLLTSVNLELTVCTGPVQVLYAVFEPADLTLMLSRFLSQETVRL